MQTKSALATSLISNEKRHGLITMFLVLAHPMNDGRKMPDVKEFYLFIRKIRNSFPEICNTVNSIPFWKVGKILFHWIVKRNHIAFKIGFYIRLQVSLFWHIHLCFNY